MSFFRSQSCTCVWVANASLAILGLMLQPRQAEAQSAFPRKPIEIIVYTRPGGLIDITARKFVKVAKNYVDAEVTFVVVNKPGSGGIAAIEKLLWKPADGHAILACTKSNIAKLVQSNRERYVSDLEWIAMLMKDPECVITRAADPRSEFSQLIADAKSNPGEQTWLGPASGGLDHIMALKVWDQFGIEAKWIPFSSGGEAKAALLGKIGVAYVGNPRDATDNDSLRVTILSSTNRLEQLPNTPTFSEFDVDGLDEQFMWRGFAIRKGCPEEALTWYANLFRDVTNDKEWRRFWEKDGIEVVYYDTPEFTTIVQQDQAEFSHYLNRLDMINTVPDSADGRAKHLGWIVPVSILVANLALAAVLIRRGQAAQLGYFLIPSLVLSLGVLFVAQAWRFPATTGVGPGAMPRLWTYAMIPLVIAVVRQALNRREQSVERDRHTIMAVNFMLLMIVYIVVTVYLGYYLGTLLFLVTAMYLLGVRQPRLAVGTAVVWLVFTYLAFSKLLRVSPPVGQVFERFI